MARAAVHGPPVVAVPAAQASGTQPICAFMSSRRRLRSINWAVQARTMQGWVGPRRKATVDA